MLSNLNSMKEIIKTDETEEKILMIPPDVKKLLHRTIT